MLLDWFNAKDAVVFAQEIAAEIDAVLSKSSRAGKSARGKNEVNRFDNLIMRVRNFARKQPLNIYKKAKFLNTIKWQLKDSGRDDELIDELLKLLTAALNT